MGGGPGRMGESASPVAARPPLTMSESWRSLGSSCHYRQVATRLEEGKGPLYWAFVTWVIAFEDLVTLWGLLKRIPSP